MHLYYNMELTNRKGKQGNRVTYCCLGNIFPIQMEVIYVKSCGIIAGYSKNFRW